MSTIQKSTVFLIAALFVMGFSMSANAETVNQILNPDKGKVWYVSINKGKGRKGTKKKPMKNIAKAVKKAKAGDTIVVSGGTYSGVRGVGYVIFEKSVKLYGSFSENWKSRNVVDNPSVFQPLNKKSQRKAFFKFTNRIKDTEDIVVDGFVFDMGERNSYDDKKGKPKGVETGMLLLPPQKNRRRGDKATTAEQVIQFETMRNGHDITIKNCVFVNGAKFAIQGGHKKGLFKIVNNVFVSNRMATIEIFGIGGRKGPRGPTKKDGDVEIAYNTILFSWSRLKDFQDMGYGIRVMTKLSYNIHHNIIGGNIMAGVDNSRFNKDEWLKMDHNQFFVNKGGDLEYSAESNTKELINADEFEDLDFESVDGNINKIPEDLPIDKAYLNGFLNARYSEQADFNRNSPANQWRQAMGMNMQGRLKTKVTMYANKYPWKKTLELFGAIRGMGAQEGME